MMQPMNSETTGFQRAGNALANVTGTSPIETGSTTLPSVSSQDAPEIAERLMARLPGETDKAMADSLARSSGVMVSARMTPNGPEATVYPVDGQKPNFEAAAEKAQWSLTPAPTLKIEEWLVRLDATVKRRKDDEAASDVRLGEYTDRLSKYPADAVKYVLREMVWEWWPAWADLNEPLERITAPRRLLVTRLRVAGEAAALPPPKQFTPPSDEAKAKAQAAMAEWTEELEQREAAEAPDPIPPQGAEWLQRRETWRQEGVRPSPQLLALINSEMETLTEKATA